MKITNKRIYGFAPDFFFKVFLTAFFLLFCFAAASHAQTSFKSTAGSLLSVKERNETFEETWRLINEKYYDAKFHGVNWRAVRIRYQPQITRTTTDGEFYALLDRMVGELRDSHTRVYSPLQREQQIKQSRTSVGITVRLIEGKAVIVGVDPDSEAARLGVKTGLIVKKINGLATEKALKKARQEIKSSSSTRSFEMRVFSKIFAGEPETVLALELIDGRGSSLRADLKRQTLRFKPKVTARRLDSGIAYLQFSGFDESIENEIRENLEKLKDAPAMILDLRDNRGGDGEMGLRFAGNFFDREITVANLVTRTGKPPIPEMPMSLRTGGENSSIYSRPIAILINEATASTAELIANAMQEQRRAIVFGTQSCGCVLGFLDYKKLEHGGFLTVSEFGFITPKNRTLEGNGVTPDKIIMPMLADIAEERDITFIQAEQFLKRSLKSSE